jgi:hypothetical protein
MMSTEGMWMTSLGVEEIKLSFLMTAPAFFFVSHRGSVYRVLGVRKTGQTSSDPIRERSIN